MELIPRERSKIGEIFLSPKEKQMSLETMRIVIAGTPKSRWVNFLDSVLLRKRFANLLTIFINHFLRCWSTDFLFKSRQGYRQ